MLSSEVVKKFIPDVNDYFLSLLIADHLRRGSIEYPELSILFNQVNQENKPFVPFYLGEIFLCLLNSRIEAVFQIMIAPPADGKTTLITQAAHLTELAFNTTQQNPIVERFIHGVEQISQAKYMPEKIVPRTERKSVIYHVSFDEARSAVLKKKGQGPLENIDWINVNLHMLNQVVEIITDIAHSNDLKVIFVEIPGIFGGVDRGTSLLRYLVQLGFPVFINVLFSDPAISEKSLALREFVLTEQQDLVEKIMKKFNIILTGFGSNPEDDAEIVDIFQKMCPPELIHIIKNKNLEGARKKRETPEYKQYIKKRSLMTLVDFLGTELPFLRLFPEKIQEELQTTTLVSYWYLTEVLRIPQDNFSLIYNALVTDQIFYDIRR